jgi:hypothetical protein
MRQFTANELVALARTFDVPILYFFMPPDGAGRRLVTEDRPAGLPCEYLLALLFGHQGNFSILADRTASWAHLLINGVDAPLSDILLDPGEAGSASSRTTATIRRVVIPSCPRMSWSPIDVEQGNHRDHRQDHPAPRAGKVGDKWPWEALPYPF